MVHTQDTARPSNLARAMKTGLVVAVATAMTFMGAAPAAMAAPDTPIFMPDAALRACVNTQLGQAATAEITEAQAATVVEVDCQGKGITNITGLEYMPNLEKVWLNNNSGITNFAPLASLTELTNLSLNNITVPESAIAAILSGSPALSFLGLMGAGLSSVNVLTTASSLRTLNVEGNMISDVSPLANLTSLESLFLGNNHVSNLSPLAALAPFNHLVAPNQTVGLGDVEVDTAEPNPVFDIDGSAVALSNLYDPSVNAFTPTALGAGSVTWNDGSLFSGTLSFNAVPQAIAYVTMPDAALRACVNTQLGQATTDPITEAQAATVTNLSCHSEGITDLTGLEAFTALQYLGLSNNTGITSRAPIMGLTSLISVELSNAGATDADLEALALLPNLSSLYLNHSNFTDVSNLSTAPALKTLWLLGNNISDLSSLAALSTLESLRLNTNPITDVSPLAALTNLTSLYMSQTKVADFSALSSLSLTTFFASGQQVELGDIEIDTATLNPVADPSGSAVALDDLYDSATNTFTPTSLGLGTVTWDNGTNFDGVLIFNGVLQPSALITMPDDNLRACVNDMLGQAPGDGITVAQAEGLIGHFSCSAENVADLTGLEHMINVEHFYLRDNTFTDLSPLSGLTSLVSLDLSSNSITDISDLAGLTTLEMLSMTSTGFTNLGQLVPLTSLRSLTLPNNGVTDVDQLGSLTALEFLNLTNNDITDVSELKNLVNLEWLILTNNNISDISGFEAFTQMSNMKLNGNHIADLSPLAGLTGLNDLDAIDQEVDLGNIVIDEAVANPVADHTGTPVALNPLYDASTNTLTPTSLGAGSADWSIPTMTGTYAGTFSGTVTFNAVTYESTLITIPDDALRACLNAALGQAPDADITYAQAATITNLSCPDMGIRDLTGVEHLTGLTSGMMFDGNHIVDISPFAALIGLEIANSVRDQHIDLGDIAINTPVPNGVVDRNGDTVPLDALYDASTATFTPVTAGAGSVGWDNGSNFSGTFSFTVIGTVIDDPIIDEDPVVDEDPVIDEDPIVDEDPIIDEAPVIDEDPVVTEDPVTTDPVLATTGSGARSSAVMTLGGVLLLAAGLLVSVFRRRTLRPSHAPTPPATSQKGTQ